MSCISTIKHDTDALPFMPQVDTIAEARLLFGDKRRYACLVLCKYGDVNGDDDVSAKSVAERVEQSADPTKSECEMERFTFAQKQLGRVRDDGGLYVQLDCKAFIEKRLGEFGAGDLDFQVMGSFIQATSAYIMQEPQRHIVKECGALLKRLVKFKRGSKRGETDLETGEESY